MALLISGIALWMLVHLFKRLAPGWRDAAIRRTGLSAVKMSVTALSFVALALIVAGFKMTPFVPVYDPPAWGRYVNNPLMFVAVVLFGMGSSRGRLRPLLRHPMLTGVLVWAAAHLLVNGDNASLVLFPAMAAWALAEIAAINAASGAWERPPPGPVAHDFRLLAISAVVFGGITFVHGLIGPSAFPG